MTATATKNQRILQTLRSSPQQFRAALIVDSDAGPQKLGSILDDWQRADFERLDDSWRAVAGVGNVAAPVLRAWLERPRGHSKTSDLAVSVAWVLFASARRLSGILAAADRDQARLLRTAVAKLVQLNPWLKEFIVVLEDRIRNPHTESECVVIASDVASSYGLLCDFIVADEVTHWADRGLWDSLLSTAAKRRVCLLLAITNAGACDTWQWTIREAIRNDPAWYFSRLDGPKARWITEDRLAEQRRLLPDLAYRRLWLNIWSSGSGNALRDDDITAALTQTGPMLGKEQGWAFVAGLDLSVSRDATALVTLAINVGWTETKERPRHKPTPINRALIEAGLLEPQRAPDVEYIRHPGTGRLRLADVQVWEPRDGSRVELSAVEAAIIATHERFGLSAVAVDPWQATLLVERLQKRGLPIYTLDQTGITLQAQASAVIDAFSERVTDLWPHLQLLADLRGLMVADRPSYGFRLVSPRATRMDTHATQHGDCATAFSIGALAAKRAVLRRVREVQGRLVCWPTAEVAA